MGFSLPDLFQLHGDLCLNVQLLNHSRSVRQRPCYSILTECFSEACLAKTTTWNWAHLPSKLMVAYSRLNLSSNVILEMRLLQINVHEASSSSTTIDHGKNTPSSSTTFCLALDIKYTMFLGESLPRTFHWRWHLVLQNLGDSPRTTLVTGLPCQGSCTLIATLPCRWEIQNSAYQKLGVRIG